VVVPVQSGPFVNSCFSDPPSGDWIWKRSDWVPSSLRIKSLPGGTGSRARDLWNYRKQSHHRRRCEHGGVSFGPVGFSGLVRGPTLLRTCSGRSESEG